MSESICSLPNDECLLYQLAGHTTNSLSGYGECLITCIALFTCNYTLVKSHKIREILTKTQKYCTVTEKTLLKILRTGNRKESRKVQNTDGRISELPKKITIHLSVKIVFWPGNRFWLSWYMQVVLVYLSSTTISDSTTILAFSSVFKWPSSIWQNTRIFFWSEPLFWQFR